MKNVYLLEGEKLDFYWNDIISGLKDCPGYFDYYDEEWTREQVKTGHLLVWALSDGKIRGIVLTRILVFPRRKVFEILALYGMDMLEFFQEMDDVFMRVASKFGCKEISCSCRPGVQRMYKKLVGAVRSEAIILRRFVNVQGDQ